MRLHRRIIAQRPRIEDEGEGGSDEDVGNESPFEDGLPVEESSEVDDEEEIFEDELHRRRFVSVNSWLSGDKTASVYAVISTRSI